MDPAGDSFALQSETPRFRLLLPAFYLGAFDVTNAQFARFLTEVRPAPGQRARWLPSSGRILAPSGTAGAHQVEDGFDQHPVVHASWYGADAYCRWAGLRLPREFEWEKGARGDDGRIFPWGNEWRDDCLRWHGGTRGENDTTAPVDAHPEGRSPYGLFQMSGNVDEWCADPFQPDIYPRYLSGDLHLPTNGYGFVVRGGTCLRRNRLEFRCAMRRGNDPALVNILYTGFRCASSVLQWTKGPDAPADRVPPVPSPGASPSGVKAPAI
jgi:iron(II)-dependent oxidoreductase